MSCEETNVKPEQLTGKVVGYRSWLLHEGNLFPLNAHAYVSFFDAPTIQGKGYESWGFNELTAVCRHSEHHSPDQACECGLYAWHDPNQLPGQDNGQYVQGAILGWGKTIVHTTGFRTEHAKIIALAYNDQMKYGDVKTVQALAKEHGIHACRHEQLEAVASEYGKVIPEFLRPVPRVDYASHYGAGATGRIAAGQKLHQHHMLALNAYQRAMEHITTKPKKRRMTSHRWFIANLALTPFVMSSYAATHSWMVFALLAMAQISTLVAQILTGRKEIKETS